MPSLNALLRVLFPNADPAAAWELQNDGDGDYIKTWAIPDVDPPESADLAAAAATWEAGAIDRARLAAIARVNEIDNYASIKAGIITGTASMMARYAHNALLVSMWRAAGSPEELDPAIYAAPISEAAAYQAVGVAVTPTALMKTWETLWAAMGTEPLRGYRRAALEKIKAAGTAEQVAAILAAFEAEVEAGLKAAGK
jgi:hypothetical protein